MIRMQIQLTEEQAARLKRLAADRGESIAAVVREAVDGVLSRDRRVEAWDRMLAVAGKYRDQEGKTDVSERHDEYFAEAIEAHLEENRRGSS